MTPIRRAFARALACALLLAASPVMAQSLISGKVNTGTPSFVNDQNVPLQLDATGALKVTGGGGSGGGASTVAGSMEQDVRSTGTLNAATANAAITTGINGQATVGYTFSGLTGSGATLTYEQSIDGGTTWTGVNAINRGTGAPEATRTTDGQIALSATGRTTIRVRVSTTGTGTITVATNVSVREGIMSLGSPLPPGANLLGRVGIDQTTPGTTNLVANQGYDGAAWRNLRTTTTGALEPPTADTGKIIATSVTLSANTSTQLVAANASRIAMEIQCDGTAAVGVSRTGGTLTSATAAPLVIPSGSYPLYTMPIATLTAVTAYTGTGQVCRVTEYLR